MISRQTIARILDTARIEEVVGDFLTLKKRGVNQVALCPFHNEKTPSFNVNPARNIFRCFGCGKGGNSVHFIMEHEKVNYPEALRYLAKKYNIEIEEVYDKDAEEEKKLADERESLFLINSFAQKYFSELLFHSPEGKSIGLAYLRERNFSDETIEKFQLGFASEKRTAFTDAALKTGYRLEYLVKTGLTIQPEENAACHDRFAGRIIFPIHNVTGRITGFGARALKENVRAKYVNSPESEIYHKSHVLYGIYFAKKVIAQYDNCFLVEGYTDVISLHQAGIENVVASCGTSLTVEQIRLVKRYTPNLTILFDGDPAGIKASFRGIDLALEEGMNVRVVLFPHGKDPDSFARMHSKTELQEFISENTTDFIRFKTQLLYEESNNDPLKKAELFKQIVESISLIPSPVTRMVYIQECSRLLAMDEKALMAELNRLLKKKFSKDFYAIYADEPTKVGKEISLQPATDRQTTGYHEKEIIRLLLNYGSKLLEIETEETDSEGKSRIIKDFVSVAEFIFENIAIDDIRFEDETCQLVFDEFIRLAHSRENISAEFFLRHENSNISRFSVDLITSPYSLSDWAGRHGIEVAKEESILKTVVEHAIYSLKIRKIQQMAAEMQKQLQEAKDEEEIYSLMVQKKQLDEAKKFFSNELGWVVLR